ncbi:MAG: universal stress protein [Rhodospirillales bacterium]
MMAEKDDIRPTPADPNRTLLCVVDNSDELSQAIRFACCRANNVGVKIALLYVIQPAEYQHWVAVGEKMREEAREEAEEMLQVVATSIQTRTGVTPSLYIREGQLEEELIKLLDEEESISLLVLGASTGTDGPGPLVTKLLREMTGKLRVPLTVVPGGLSEEQIDAIT